MSRRRATFRLVARIYLFTASTSFLMAVALAAVMALLADPPQQMVRAAQYMVSTLAAHRNDPAAMSREAARFRDELGVEITLHAVEGKVLVSNVDPPSQPLPRDLLRRLERGESTVVHGAPRRVVVGIRERGSLMGYGEVVHALLLREWPLMALPFAAFLVALVVTSVLFARHMSRPITLLARTTRAFGAGDLEARVSLDRGDELGELARAFNEMADRINLLLGAQKELMAGISHELRTPLARIRVALDIADLEHSEGERPELAEIARDLVEIEQIVNNIFMTARLDLQNGKGSLASLPLRRVSVDARSMLEEAAQRFRQDHSTRSLHLALADELPAIQADRVLLRRVVGNLLDNAAKYSEEGEAITLRARGVVEGLVVEVEDQGMGIARSQIGDVFKPFFRADASRARATGGVGLGLALARRIVEAHGGTIAIESVEGQGTLVRFSVPAQA